MGMVCKLGHSFETGSSLKLFRKKVKKKEVIHFFAIATRN
jgi:hypothetical protein